MAHGGSSGGSYSPLTGFVFIFNLIVGAGALTIPHAFAQVGLVYGVVALSILALTSYVTATFMIEAIAGVNALKKRRRELRGSQDDENEDNHPDDQGRTQSEEISTTEFMPLMVSKDVHEDDRLEKAQLRKSSPDLVYDFDLSRKVELAQMAHALFNRHGIIAFYSCVVVYLYGDLAIYAVAVPKSLREIVCPRPHPNALIWQCSNGFNSSELYRFFVVVFGLVLGPFTFGNVQKTRTLQFITTIVRHVSFGLMIILAVNGIARGEGRKVPDVIADEHPRNIATFFGVCIYSFMCHHSVPGLVAPITNMKQVGKVIAGAFLAVLSVYLTLCISATFRFKPEDVSDVYTLNFKNYPVRVVAYFLSLFPVCTLSANFPVICITLRENLRTLAHNIGQQGNDQQGQSILSCNSYALFALVPPLVVAFFTEDVSMLVGYTGAYAGLGIQWVVPASLVFCLRRQLDQEHSQGLKLKPLRPKNPFASPFSHNGWLYLTFTMSVLAIVTITLTHSVK